MSYLYGLIHPYNISEARRRSSFFADQSERDLQRANEILRKEIDQWSYTGYTWASVDIDFSTYGEQGSYVTSADLADMYREAGYKVFIKELFNSVDDKVKGYRVEVSWEE